MHLYHHAFSMNSQKVRLALEEKAIDYVSHSVNPLKGKDLDAELVQLNPNGQIPVLADGSNVVCETLGIIQFIDNLNEPLGGDNVDGEAVRAWMLRVQDWSPKLFTQSNAPNGLQSYVSKFKRRVAMARSLDHPELAAKYRAILDKAYATEAKLRSEEAVRENLEQLVELLKEAEDALSKCKFLAGDAFTAADAMFIPVLARLELLGRDEAYVRPLPHLWGYWARMKLRSSYHIVIGQYFSGVNRYKTLLTTGLHIFFRNLLKRY